LTLSAKMVRKVPGRVWACKANGKNNINNNFEILTYILLLI
jgi:hypothetical protein